MITLILTTILAAIVAVGVLVVVFAPFSIKLRKSAEVEFEIQIGYCMPYVWTSAYFIIVHKHYLNDDGEVTAAFVKFAFWRTDKHYYISGKEFTAYSLEQEEEDEDFAKLAEAREYQRYFEEQL